jgi:hypothetical protein
MYNLKTSVYMRIVILIIFVLFSGCSSDLRPSTEFSSAKWISTSGPNCEVWFQDWVDYTRLLIVYDIDTLDVNPSPYAVETKAKPYRKVVKQQLIGNIYWNGEPSWDSGTVNSFTWEVDRANPKIILPQNFIVKVSLVKNALNMQVVKDGGSFLSLNLRALDHK